MIELKCHLFILGAKKPATKRKKAIPKTQISQLPNTANETAAELVTETSVMPTAKVMAKRGNDWTVNLNEFLRCMDPDVIVFFECFDLNLEYPLPKEKIGKCLGLVEFKYVDRLLSVEIHALSDKI